MDRKGNLLSSSYVTKEGKDSHANLSKKSKVPHSIYSFIICMKKEDTKPPQTLSHCEITELNAAEHKSHARQITS